MAGLVPTIHAILLRGPFTGVAPSEQKHDVLLPAFTTLRGGAYFFLPGLKTLAYLASLNEDGRA